MSDEGSVHPSLPPPPPPGGRSNFVTDPFDGIEGRASRLSRGATRRFCFTHSRHGGWLFPTTRLELIKRGLFSLKFIYLQPQIEVKELSVSIKVYKNRKNIAVRTVI